MSEGENKNATTSKLLIGKKEDESWEQFKKRAVNQMMAHLKGDSNTPRKRDWQGRAAPRHELEDVSED